jgi:membrane-associated phospholipid phosphatase
MVSLLKKNKAFFFPYFLFLLAGGIVLAVWSKTDIHSYINGYHNSVADLFFSNLTNLGLGVTIIPVLLILAFIRFRYVIISLLGFIIAFIINDSLKVLLHTPRPINVFAQLHQPLYLVPKVEMFYWNGLPSGHSATAFCMFCLLAFYTKNNLIKTIYFLTAFLIAYSRMYLSEHFLQDVYLGSLIGVGSALLAYFIVMNGRFFYKFAEKLDRPLIRLSKKNK